MTGLSAEDVARVERLIEMACGSAYLQGGVALMYVSDGSPDDVFAAARAAAQYAGQVLSLRALLADHARLVQERDEARAERDARQSGWEEAGHQRARADLADLRLAEICELCGPGGDGTAFGCAESAIATLTQRAEQAESALARLQPPTQDQEGQ